MDADALTGNMLWKLLTAGSLLVSMSCSAAACSEFYYEHCRYDQYTVYCYYRSLYWYGDESVLLPG
jgi:hypothetical protein